MHQLRSCTKFSIQVFIGHLLNGHPVDLSRQVRILLGRAKLTIYAYGITGANPQIKNCRRLKCYSCDRAIGQRSTSLSWKSTSIPHLSELYNAARVFGIRNRWPFCGKECFLSFASWRGKGSWANWKIVVALHGVGLINASSSWNYYADMHF